jgi:hypothetical protein
MLRNSASAVGFIPQLREIVVPQELLESIVTAYADSLRSIWYVLAAFAALGAIASVFLKELSLESEETGRQNWEAKE